jgi:hypothetical protein
MTKTIITLAAALLFGVTATAQANNRNNREVQGSGRSFCTGPLGQHFNTCSQWDPDYASGRGGPYGPYGPYGADYASHHHRISR